MIIPRRKIIDTSCPWGRELGNREGWEQNFSLCTVAYFLNFKLHILNFKPLRKSFIKNKESMPLFYTSIHTHMHTHPF